MNWVFKLDRYSFFLKGLMLFFSCRSFEFFQCCPMFIQLKHCFCVSFYQRGICPKFLHNFVHCFFMTLLTMEFFVQNFHWHFCSACLAYCKHWSPAVYETSHTTGWVSWYNSWPTGTAQGSSYFRVLGEPIKDMLGVAGIYPWNSLHFAWQPSARVWRSLRSCFNHMIGVNK